jgi:hypothetical protein
MSSTRNIVHKNRDINFNFIFHQNHVLNNITLICGEDIDNWLSFLKKNHHLLLL